MNAERIDRLRHSVLVAAGFVRDDVNPTMTKDDCADLLALLDEAASLAGKGGSDVIRPEVMAFARLMEDRLQANEGKGGWKNCNLDFLLTRLYGEAGELAHEVNTGQFIWVDKEAADVGNFAMMIVDVCGRLNAKPSLPPAPQAPGSCERNERRTP